MTNKLLTLLFLWLCISSIFAVTSCSNRMDDPEKTVNKAIQIIKNNKFNDFISVCDLDNENIKESCEKLFEKEISPILKKKDGIASHEIYYTKIKDDKAMVKVHIFFGDSSKSDWMFNLKEVNDDWLIVIGMDNSLFMK